MSEIEIANKIKQLKLRVSQLVNEVNDLKTQLNESSISLSEFKSKKETLQDELRGILEQIAKYKEIAGVSPVAKKESEVAQQAKDLMYYFQTEFIDDITKARIYLSITLDKHFIFSIDFKNYPERPKLILPNTINEKFASAEEFLQKVPSYQNWDQNKQIYELVTEVETVLINAYSADLESIEQASKEYLDETRDLINQLIQRARKELDEQNVDSVIEIYKSIIDLSYQIKDFKLVSEYTRKLDDVLKIIRGNK
ncbi:MAG: hypothetical protein EU551_01485 [Promethearchaeota archaeon]|nr:MAG: hypothetical protein EU551_01485 [Candidatus Lokiarchaeota archaeon]